MTDEKSLRFCSLVQKSAEMSTMKNAVLSCPSSSDVQKIKCSLKNISGAVCIQIEYMCTEGRVRQENIGVDRISERLSELVGDFSRCELNDSGGTASLMRSKKGKVTLLTRGNIGSGEPSVQTSDEKNYILSGSEPFLMHLGISDKNGRVHDKKQAKFRQINRFIEHIRDAASRLPSEGDIVVADLCCGKSYLSFAVYHYLSDVLHRRVVMDCIDLKESVMSFCSDIASKCGFNGMHFTAGNIDEYKPVQRPHLVISLHACDTATDIVLEKAVALGADMIFSTPCCHRQLSRELDCGELSFVSSSILKSKMCDALTDSLRVLRLEASGYKADAVELIDPEDTPKNVLIRAFRRKEPVYGKAAAAKAEKYKNAYRFLCSKEPPKLYYETE